MTIHPRLVAQCRLATPFGELTAAASDRGLAGLWFDGIMPLGLSSRQFGGGLPGTTGTTGTTSCGRFLAIAVTMALRVWTEMGTP